MNSHVAVDDDILLVVVCLLSNQGLVGYFKPCDRILINVIILTY